MGVLGTIKPGSIGSHTGLVEATAGSVLVILAVSIHAITTGLQIVNPNTAGRTQLNGLTSPTALFQGLYR